MKGWEEEDGGMGKMERWGEMGGVGDRGMGRWKDGRVKSEGDREMEDGGMGGRWKDKRWRDRRHGR